ncbi:MAG: hypothetical protein QNJ75_00395 [Acidimicrobiia bacterium]|nr:hypothetical protein [Acidimicrobiia bacterium]
MQAPTTRISNVLARHGIAQRRSPRWVNDADARQIARVNEVVNALRVR